MANTLAIHIDVKPPLRRRIAAGIAAVVTPVISVALTLALEPSSNALPTRAPRDIVLTVRADENIVAVRSPWVQDVDIEGDHARVFVGTWAGALPIEAVLQDGRLAHATVDSAGPRGVVQLVSAP